MVYGQEMHRNSGQNAPLFLVLLKCRGRSYLFGVIRVFNNKDGVVTKKLMSNLHMCMENEELRAVRTYDVQVRQG